VSVCLSVCCCGNRLASNILPFRQRARLQHKSKRCREELRVRLADVSGKLRGFRSAFEDMQDFIDVPVRTTACWPFAGDKDALYSTIFREDTYSSRYSFSSFKDLPSRIIVGRSLKVDP
jgi:hypothetical protein